MAWKYFKVKTWKFCFDNLSICVRQSKKCKSSEDLSSFNKTIIPLALVGSEMITANSALRSSLAIYQRPYDTTTATATSALQTHHCASISSHAGVVKGRGERQWMRCAVLSKREVCVSKERVLQRRKCDIWAIFYYFVGQQLTFSVYRWMISKCSRWSHLAKFYFQRGCLEWQGY